VVLGGSCFGDVGIRDGKISNFSSTSNPYTGMWVLENDFNIGTGRWDLICNLFFLT